MLMRYLLIALLSAALLFVFVEASSPSVGYSNGQVTAVHVQHDDTSSGGCGFCPGLCVNGVCIT